MEPRRSKSDSSKTQRSAATRTSTTGRVDGRQRRPVPGFQRSKDFRVIERAPLGSPDRPAPAAQLYADFATDTGRPSETRDGSIIAFERQTTAGIEIWTRNVRSRTEQLIAGVDTTRGLSATI